MTNEKNTYDDSEFEYTHTEQGYTLRDYFAGQALAGILSLPILSGETPEDFARRAYRVADAMLEAREEG
jgi:hypothetical protein